MRRGGAPPGLRQAAALVLAVLAGSAAAPGTVGVVHLNLRARWEQAQQADGRDVRAGTLRTRLGWEWPTWRGWSAYGEFEDVRLLLGPGRYAPRDPARATVADPPVTQLNQACLQGRGLRGLRVRWGRQRIVLDNHRFVGNVGWRQNEQTFDALGFEAWPAPAAGGTCS